MISNPISSGDSEYGAGKSEGSEIDNPWSPRPLRIGVSRGILAYPPDESGLEGWTKPKTMSEKEVCSYCGASTDEKFCSGHCAIEGMTESRVKAEQSKEVAL